MTIFFDIENKMMKKKLKKSNRYNQVCGTFRKMKDEMLLSNWIKKFIFGSLLRPTTFSMLRFSKKGKALLRKADFEWKALTREADLEVNVWKMKSSQSLVGRKGLVPVFFAPGTKPKKNNMKDWPRQAHPPSCAQGSRNYFVQWIENGPFWCQALATMSRSRAIYIYCAFFRQQSNAL